MSGGSATLSEEKELRLCLRFGRSFPMSQAESELRLGLPRVGMFSSSSMAPAFRILEVCLRILVLTVRVRLPFIELDFNAHS